MSNEIEIRDGACGPICPRCDSDEDTFFAEAETESPSGEILSADDREAVPHYWCNGCGNLMVIETGKWILV